MYLDAVEDLYAYDGLPLTTPTQDVCGTSGPAGGKIDLNKLKRDSDYMKAMKHLSDAYPEDDEARSFYALSILGIENGTHVFTTYEGSCGGLARLRTQSTSSWRPLTTSSIPLTILFTRLSGLKPPMPIPRSPPTRPMPST